jgi:Flp pilus assembly pilin Flp
MKNLFVNMWRENDGQDMIEYVLIAGLVSIVAVTFVQAAGVSITGVWTQVSTDLSTAAGA